MPPYLCLSLLMGCIWMIFFIIRKEMRKQMLIMSTAVIPFAFFDYFSQPTYWHPETMFSIPVGIEGVLFGFSFGGVAAVIFGRRKNVDNIFSSPVIDLRNLLTLLPVLILSVGLWILFNLNMMVSLPIGLVAGCLIIAIVRPGLVMQILYSALYFGLLYSIVFACWLFLYPQSQDWWNLSIYGNLTVLNVPMGEVLFGFLFGGFWSASYEFSINPGSVHRTDTRGVVHEDLVMP